MKAQRALVLIFLMVCAGVVATLFWKSELKYALPTPVPSNYQAVAINEKIELPSAFQANGEPLYFHFYNPDCPCSKFNAKHVKNLIHSYGRSVRASIVVSDERAKTKASKEFNNLLPIIIDRDGALARACGVYATPQAVIISKASTLYYRGNYNKARFCTARATNFAELALISLLNNNPAPPPTPLATTSYGCQLSVQNDLDFF